MKRYKIYWSILNLTQATQEEVVKLQGVWMAISGIVTTSTVVTASEKHAFYVAIICAVVDKLIGCFFLEEKK